MSETAILDARTGLEAARFAVYVHFPYCLSKCPYCDFASVAAKELPQERYTRAVLRELSARRERLGPRRVDSLYFGGGTPSLWDAHRVGEVVEAVAQAFSLAARAEVTLEANPGAADAQRFRAYRAAGVNRLSMGVQSFHPQTLATLGRAHSGPEAVRAYEAARQAGFEDVSLDFIYGVHGQTEAQVRADAVQAAALGPEHLSAYALTLDRESLAEEVPLAKQLARGEVRLPPDEAVVAMQRAVSEAYRAAGLQRYEVSNYARPGRHSRHNAAYWTGGETLALGVGATGFLREGPGGVRITNHRSAERYLSAVEAGQLPEATREVLGAMELFEERLAMGLRLTGGVDVAAVCADFGQPFEGRGRLVAELVRAGLASVRGARVALTDAGLDVHSEVCVRLLDAERG